MSATISQQQREERSKVLSDKGAHANTNMSNVLVDAVPGVLGCSAGRGACS